MINNREYETYARVGVEPPRSYYVPFAQEQEIAFLYGIDDNGFLQMRKLTGRKRKQVLINYLRRRSGREMKVESITKAFNVSVRSMPKILKELEEESFIRRERMYDEGGKQRANRIIYIGERPRLTGKEMQIERSALRTTL